MERHNEEGIVCWDNIGAEFWSLDSSYESIYSSFSILNYVNPAYELKVKKRAYFKLRGSEQDMVA